MYLTSKYSQDFKQIYARVVLLCTKSNGSSPQELLRRRRFRNSSPISPRLPPGSPPPIDFKSRGVGSIGGDGGGRPAQGVGDPRPEAEARRARRPRAPRPHRQAGPAHHAPPQVARQAPLRDVVSNADPNTNPNCPPARSIPPRADFRCIVRPKNARLLGLNVNRGAEVKLRLRRDGRDHDFIPYEEVLDTMLHELAHIVRGPHDAQFYKLWDELRKVRIRMSMTVPLYWC